MRHVSVRLVLTYDVDNKYVKLKGKCQLFQLASARNGGVEDPAKLQGMVRAAICNVLPQYAGPGACRMAEGRRSVSIAPCNPSAKSGLRLRSSTS